MILNSAENTNMKPTNMLEQELEFAKGIARTAGGIALSLAKPEVEIKSKGIEGDVTAGDFASDKYIIDMLTNRFADYGIITEERKDNPERLTRDKVWIVDPIDGTAQYIRYAQGGRDERYDEWAIQIGLSEKGRAVLGVIYKPVGDELYFAASGLGAFLEKEGTITRLKIDDNLTGKFKTTGAFLRLPETQDLALKIFNITGKVERYYGSIGLALASLANNKIDAYCQTSEKHKLGEWDLCAPEVIVREAGGVVTNRYGKEYAYNKREPYCISTVIAQKKPGIII